MLRRLYDWTKKLSAGRHANLALFSVGFAESSFFPFPPDIIMVPLIMGRPERAYFYAILCGCSSVIGGLFGYWIGYEVWEYVGPLLLGSGIVSQAGILSFQRMVQDWGPWIIMLKGLTPVPYKIVTIGCGIAHYDLLPFVLYSFISRNLRFLAVAWLLKRYPEKSQKIIEGNLELITVALLIVIVGGLWAAQHFA